MQSRTTKTKELTRPVLSPSATAIEFLIKKYSVGLDQLPERAVPQAILQGPVVVLLTGSTGHLGSALLADLLENDQVGHVYTFNRPSRFGDTIEERQIKMFNKRGLNTDILRSKRLSYIIGDATRLDLGIESDQYALLSRSVNVVIHNAWQVSFTRPLSDFVPNIQAIRHLIDFLRAGPFAAHGRFLFTSSFTVAQSWTPSDGYYPEEIVSDASFAVGTGYGESKYVAERILAKSGLHTTSFRVAQMCGGAPKGVWNTTEWVPVLLKSSIAIGRFPDMKGMVSWIPVNHAAAAIVEAALSIDEVLPRAANLVNSRPINCSILNDYLIAAAKELLGVRLDTIPMKEWISIVERLSVNPNKETLKEIPAIKLLPFLRDISRRVSQVLSSRIMSEFNLPIFATETMCRISPHSMMELQPIQKEDVRMWVKYWQDVNYVDRVRHRL